MVVYHVPSREEFQSFVLKEFRFLVDKYEFQEHGPTNYNPFSFRYKKDSLVVEIQGNSYGFSTGVDILEINKVSGEVVHRYWLTTFVKLRRPDLLRPEFPEQRGQLRQLEKSALMLRDCAHNVLSGDLSELPKILMLQNEFIAKNKEEADREEMKRIDAQSLNAFGNKDFITVVRLLEPQVASLSEAQMKRLAYARKHVWCFEES